MGANGVGVGAGGGKTVLDCLMHKLPSSRKHYHVRLFVPDNGIPFIDYRQVSNFVGSRKAAKTIPFADLLFADKKHEASEKFAFSIYSIDKTITFLPQDESIMNEWLTKIRELHANVYPEFKRYDAIFEARLLDKGLATTMHIQGHYRLAVCKESLDLLPLLTVQDQQQQQNAANLKSATTSTATSSVTNSNSCSTNGSSNNNNNNNNNSIINNNSGIQHNLVQHETNLSNNFNSSYLKNHHHQQAHQASHHSSKLGQSQAHHHHHLPQHQQSHQRFCKRHPQLASKTIELGLRSIRRCGHTQANFYIESGRHSQIGEGDLWMALDRKSTARLLHELLLATMKLASTNDDQFLFKAPRSRSGSSSDNAHRSQQSRSSSLVCLNADLSNLSNTSSTVTQTATTTAATCYSSNNNNNNNLTPVNMDTTTATINGGTPSATPAASPASTQGGKITNGGSGGTTFGGSFLNSLFGNQQLSPAGGTAASEKSLAAEISQAAAINSISTMPMFPNHDNNTIEEDSGYLPMA